MVKKTSAPTKQPTKDLRPIIILGIAGLAALLAIVWGSLTSTNPDKLFWTAINNTLSTKSVSQKLVDQQNDSITLLYDVANPKQAKVATKVVYPASQIEIDGYGSGQNTYVRLVSDASLYKDTPSLQQLFNRWVQIRNGGKLPGTYSEVNGLDGNTEPRQVLFGDIIFGNFDTKEQQTLVKYIRDHKVYSYDKRKVKDSTYDGQDTKEYIVSLNKDALRNLNAQMAPLFGFSAQEVTDGFDKGTHPATATWEIATKSKELIGVKVSIGSDKNATTYYKYNSTDVGSEPKADIQWDAYAALMLSAQSDLINL